MAPEVQSLDRPAQPVPTAPPPPRPALMRAHSRWPYRPPSVSVDLFLPSGRKATATMDCRNLSAGGVGLRHHTFIPLSTRCLARLPNVRGQVVDVGGRIVRCAALDAGLYDIGLRFDHELRARDFVALDPFCGEYAYEQVTPQTLRGDILYIEDSEMDQALMKFFLRDTQVRLTIVSTKEEALAQTTGPLDLILCDYNLGDEFGDDWVRFLRAKGVSTPVIMVTADTSLATREKLIRARANGFLSKPLNPTRLRGAIAEFLGLSTAAGGLRPDLPAGHPALPLVPVFIEQMRSKCTRIEEAIQERSAERCRVLCLEIAGSAPVMGYPRLAALACESIGVLGSEPEFEGAVGALRTLTTACLQISAPETC